MILDIVVDVQKDFITGALANPQAQANVAHLAETVKAHARAGHWLFLCHTSCLRRHLYCLCRTNGVAVAAIHTVSQYFGLCATYLDIACRADCGALPAAHTFGRVHTDHNFFPHVRATPHNSRLAA